MPGAGEGVPGADRRDRRSGTRLGAAGPRRGGGRLPAPPAGPMRRTTSRTGARAGALTRTARPGLDRPSSAFIHPGAWRRPCRPRSSRPARLVSGPEESYGPTTHAAHLICHPYLLSNQLRAASQAKNASRRPIWAHRLQARSAPEAPAATEKKLSAGRPEAIWRLVLLASGFAGRGRYDSAGARRRAGARPPRRAISPGKVTRPAIGRIIHRPFCPESGHGASGSNELRDSATLRPASMGRPA